MPIIGGAFIVPLPPQPTKILGGPWPTCTVAFLCHEQDGHSAESMPSVA